MDKRKAKGPLFTNLEPYLRDAEAFPRDAAEYMFQQKLAKLPDAFSAFGIKPPELGASPEATLMAHQELLFAALTRHYPKAFTIAGARKGHAEGSKRNDSKAALAVRKAMARSIIAGHPVSDRAAAGLVPWTEKSMLGLSARTAQSAAEELRARERFHPSKRFSDEMGSPAIVLLEGKVLRPLTANQEKIAVNGTIQIFFREEKLGRMGSFATAIALAFDTMRASADPLRVLPESMRTVIEAHAEKCPHGILFIDTADSDGTHGAAFAEAMAGTGVTGVQTQIATGTLNGLPAPSIILVGIPPTILFS